MTLLAVENLWVFRKPEGLFRPLIASAPSRIAAVQNVSLQLPHGSIVGIAGETGSGKTSLAMALLKVLPRHSGTITFDGHPIHRMPEWRFRKLRGSLQLLYSHPRDAFHPKWTVERLFTEVFSIHAPQAQDRDKQMRELLDVVELEPSCLQRFPRDLSLFDQQRVAIARILAIRPRLLICDDPTRPLDTVSEARLLDLLLLEVHERWRIPMLYLARDYSVVDHMSSYIYVMNTGRVLEEGTPHDLFHTPQHEYTRQLLALSGAL